MEVIAVDWSGAKSGAGKKIWLASTSQAYRLTELRNGLDRDQIAAYLLERAKAAPEQLIIGLDFAFSFPMWFVRRRGVRSVEDMWEVAAEQGEEWLATCPWPFWGRKGHPCPPNLPDKFRRTESEVPSIKGIQPKSVFQVGGAGAVGTGSLRGMPILKRLREAGFCVWPFDAPGPRTVVEIWPRLLTGPVKKSRLRDRKDYVATRYPGLEQTHTNQLLSSDDAFDAGVCALVMITQSDALSRLKKGTDEQQLLEGCIWRPGGTRHG